MGYTCTGDRRNGNKKTVKICNIDLEDIREKGKIIAVTDYNSTDYFIYRGEPMGYQYDLLTELANHLEVELEIFVENDLDKTFEYLNCGNCDLIALNLTVTKQRNKLVSFTIPYSQTRQVLIQRKPDKWRIMHPERVEKQLIRNQLDLAGKTIYIQKGSAFLSRLRNLSEEIGDSIPIIETKEDTEHLVRLVASGEIDYTVCDENVAKVNKTYYPILDIETAISFPQNLAWAVRKKNSDNLLSTINEWLTEFRKTTKFAVIYNKYFKNQKSKYIVESDLYPLTSGKISPYDEIVRKYSDSLGWEWLLLTSMIYQESRFDPKVTSWAGAYGLMQLMPTTSRRYGITKNSSPAENIEAGVKFLKWLDNVLEDKVSDENERRKFVLGAYNVGLGHILDARGLARKYGKDPGIWDNNVSDFLLKKSDPQYFQDPVVKYGYCRGEEPFNYVKEILDRYEHYMNIIGGE